MLRIDWMGTSLWGKCDEKRNEKEDCGWNIKKWNIQGHFSLMSGTSEEWKGVSRWRTAWDDRARNHGSKNIQKIKLSMKKIIAVHSYNNHLFHLTRAMRKPIMHHNAYKSFNSRRAATTRVDPIITKMKMALESVKSQRITVYTFTRNQRKR